MFNCIYEKSHPTIKALKVHIDASQMKENIYYTVNKYKVVVRITLS